MRQDNRKNSHNEVAKSDSINKRDENGKRKKHIRRQEQKSRENNARNNMFYVP
jgi:hypothetical protein